MPDAGQSSSHRQSNGNRRNNQPDILLGIFRQLYRHCKLNGINYWYSAVEKSLARLMNSLFNFIPEPIGEQVDYYGPVTPYLVAIDDFERGLSIKDATIFAWYQEALNE